MAVRGVLFDWRGTLAVTPDEEDWVATALHRTGRPAFAAAGLDGLVDVLTLSSEQGVQKPGPRMFTRTLAALGCSRPTRPWSATARVRTAEPWRSAPHPAAAPLTGPDDRRLDRVLALCGHPDRSHM
ncbi:hypothetical protein [Blastococcus capsensis]|uniref:hypothetical protein n=1 Tax=Blastococcus capsensis TaxID=1564163 RepID=UPI0025422B61|nr:hypothetical protein [Blastococcus capsensis]MDK3257994.1 hypothetical protein [Blastococcus capsensis]